MKKRIITITLALVLLVSMIAAPSAATATTVPDVLMGFCLDSSGSIGSSNWSLVRTGLANAIYDETIVPRDGSVEICIVTFSSSTSVILEPTVVTAANIESIKATILAMPYLNGSTAMGDGIAKCLDTMDNSPNFNNSAVWKVINLATDGQPNVSPSGYTHEGWVEHNVDLAVAAGIQELDVEAITTGPDTTWLATKIAYPDGTGAGVAPIVPPASYPPRPPDPNFMGFVRKCTTFEDYEGAVAQKLILILKGQLSLTPVDATNEVGDQHCVTATLLDGYLDPMEGKTIGFTVTGVNPTSGSDVTDSNGQAQFCYTGTNPGVDTITATWDDSQVSGQVLNSVATKTWTTTTTTTTETTFTAPPTTEVGGNVQPVNKLFILTPVIALGIAFLAVIGIIIRRRVTQR